MQLCVPSQVLQVLQVSEVMLVRSPSSEEEEQSAHVCSDTGFKLWYWSKSTQCKNTLWKCYFSKSL